VLSFVRAAQITLGFLIMLGPVFFRFPAKHLEFSPSLVFLWYYAFPEKGKIEEKINLPARWVAKSIQPFNGVTTERGDHGLLVLADRSRELEKDEMAFAPLHGQGYFLFERTGKEIAFYSTQDELLWKKPFPAYPVTGPSGRSVFLLTGDGNRVDVLDQSGNLVGVKHIAGNFLTDYRFASRAAVSVFLFGSGGAYGLSDQGQILFKYEDSDHPRFCKSLAISSDGTRVAIHSLKENTDTILVLRIDEGKVKKQYEVDLQTIYPYSIAMAVHNWGSVIIGTSDRTSFASGGDWIWTDPTPVKGPRYAYSDDSFLSITGPVSAGIFQPDGRRLTSIPYPGDEPGPFTLVPGNASNAVILQGKQSLSFYSFEKL